jgi:hypothetical protein
MSDDSNSGAEQERDGLVRELASLPGELERMVRGQSDEALLRPSSGGGWSFVEIVCHLLDWEEVFLGRLESVLSEENPELPAFDGGLWEIEHDYRSQDPDRVLARFGEVRGRFANRLAELPPDSWQRSGDHRLHGPVTVDWLATQVRDHSREHLAQIRDALA